MKLSPEQVVLKPALTEKSEILKQEGKYVFFVNPEANRVQVAEAIEAIYNRGRKKKDRIAVEKVNMITVHGKSARSGFRTSGKRPTRKKAVVTLAPGQMLEDIGA